MAKRIVFSDALKRKIKDGKKLKAHYARISIKAKIRAMGPISARDILRELRGVKATERNAALLELIDGGNIEMKIQDGFTKYAWIKD